MREEFKEDLIVAMMGILALILVIFCLDAFSTGSDYEYLKCHENTKILNKKACDIHLSHYEKWTKQDD